MSGDPEAWRRRPRVPQPGTPPGKIEEVPEGSAKEYTFGGGKAKFSMFVVNRAGDLFAYLNLCPHYSSPSMFGTGSF